MEKVDVLVHGGADGLLEAASALDVPGLTVSVAAELERPTLLMGKGADLAGLVELWLHSVDDRHGPLEVLAGVGRTDAFLVTESVPQREPGSSPLGERSPGITHLTWFPKPDRLTERAFLHGWHDAHTPSSFALHPRRDGYVRDSVVRVLTDGSPPLRAIVSEHFPEVEDYTDPRRLFGGPEALEATMAELPLYADQEDISSRPLWRHVVRRALA